MDDRFHLGDEDVSVGLTFVDRGSSVSGAAPIQQPCFETSEAGTSHARTSVAGRAGNCPSQDVTSSNPPTSSAANPVGASPIVRQSWTFLLGIASGITGGIIVNQIEGSGITRDISSLVSFYRVFGDVGNFSVNNVNFIAYMFTMLQGVYWLIIRHRVHPLYGPLSLVIITSIGAIYILYKVFSDCESLQENKSFTIISIVTVIFIIAAAFFAHILFRFLEGRAHVPTNTLPQIIYAIGMPILGLIAIYATILLGVLILGIVFVIIAIAAIPGDGLGIFLICFAWTLSWYPLLVHAGREFTTRNVSRGSVS